MPRSYCWGTRQLRRRDAHLAPGLPIRPGEPGLVGITNITDTSCQASYGLRRVLAPVRDSAAAKPQQTEWDDAVFSPREGLRTLILEPATPASGQSTRQPCGVLEIPDSVRPAIDFSRERLYFDSWPLTWCPLCAIAERRIPRCRRPAQGCCTVVRPPFRRRSAVSRPVSRR